MIPKKKFPIERIICKWLSTCSPLLCVYVHVHVVYVYGNKFLELVNREEVHLKPNVSPTLVLLILSRSSQSVELCKCCGKSSKTVK